jgi:hypothetical protein
MLVFNKNIQETERERSSVWRLRMCYSQFVNFCNRESEFFWKIQRDVSKEFVGGLEKGADLSVKEASSLCVVCSKYLLKWIVSCNEFDCFR